MPNRPDLRPVPDPTVQTTHQLDVAIHALRDVIEARLNGMDKAILLLQSMPPVGERVAKHDEQIADLAERFRLTDKVAEVRLDKSNQQFLDSKEATALALDAADKAIANAFSAAEKAVAKAELAAEKGYLESQIHSLREAFTQQIRSQKEALEAALASSDKAVLKAEVANEKRFESVNEFRSTLADQQLGLATKSECDLRFKAAEERLTMVIEDFRELKGRISVSDPAITQEIRNLRGAATDLSRSRDTIGGASHNSEIVGARMMSMLAIGIAAVVGIGTIFVRLIH